MSTAHQEREKAARAVERFNHRACAWWNHGNLNEFVTGYARNATWTTDQSGTVTGKHNILKTYQNQFPTADKMGTIRTRLIELLLPGDRIDPRLTQDVDPDTLAAVATIEVYTDFGDGQVHKSFNTLVFVKSATDMIGISVLKDIELAL